MAANDEFPGAEGPPRSGIDRWEEVQNDLHADCRVFSVRRSRCRHPKRNEERDFFVIDSPNWVNIVALTEDKKLVLINQFRFGVADFSLEIPGGLIDPGEDPINAGLRELAEETGYVSDTARLLGSVQPNPAIMNNTCHFVLAEKATPSGEVSWDADEEIEVVLAKPQTAMDWARNGQIQHSMVLNALFLFEPVWQEMVANSARPD